MDNVEHIDPSLHYLELPLLAMNHNGRFERADSGITAPVAGAGAAFGDLNNDGWEDVVTTSLGGHPQVLFNNGGNRAVRRTGWWISLRGTRSNRDGFGARVQMNADPIRDLGWQLSFGERQTIAFWTRSSGNSQDPKWCGHQAFIRH